MDTGVPHRIYDPGGTAAGLAKGGEEPQPTPSSYQQLVAENNVLKERMKGLKSLGNLLEESQTEASKLKQKVEQLVRQEVLRSTVSLLPQEMQSSVITSAEGSMQPSSQTPLRDPEQPRKPEEARGEEKPTSTGSSSEFEVVNSIDKIDVQEGSHKDVLQRLANEDGDLSVHLQRLENSLSMFAEETNKKHLLAHLGRMAVEFNRLSSKVQKNENRTGILQTLCRQLQAENEELRRKLDRDLDLKSQMLAKMKCEHLKLKDAVVVQEEGQQSDAFEVVARPGCVQLLAQGAEPKQNVKVGDCQLPQDRTSTETLEKKVAALEAQRKELLDVNKQWDQQFRGMKHQYEQKIVTLRQRLALVQRELSDRESSCDEKQRDFDRKLLLAKSKLDNGETEKERFLMEIQGLKQENQCLRDQLEPLSRQRECQEKEIQRLNKALEEALLLRSPALQLPPLSGTGDLCGNTRRSEMLTQIEVLKQQVKIFEEDFLRERSDRERMSEEKEELRKKLEKVQSEMLVLNTQGMSERRASDPPPGAPQLYCPTYQLPYAALPHPGPIFRPFDLQIHYPPSAMPPGHHPYQPPDYPWNVAYPPARSQHAEPDLAKTDRKEPSSPGPGKGQP
ncbi:TNFAIP3-interacting protein 1 isoform X2 [Narcine bancroftii]|uniref:TNFAIP3-interacting protein 1 isoform X2 n=1 Tax=Narcine bancroftii TaxID=1343680 RepID=UPI003831374D